MYYENKTGKNHQTSHPSIQYNQTQIKNTSDQDSKVDLKDSKHVACCCLSKKYYIL